MLTMVTVERRIVTRYLVDSGDLVLNAGDLVMRHDGKLEPTHLYSVKYATESGAEPVKGTVSPFQFHEALTPKGKV